jgi:Undecaprenyl-phosphate glucose phosphotransferase
MAELTSSSAIKSTAYKIRGNRNPHPIKNSQHIKPYQALTFLCLVDFLVVLASGGIGIRIVENFYPEISISQYGPVWLAIAVASLLFFLGLGCYKSLPADCRNQLPTLCIGFSLPILLITFILFSLKIGDQYSRAWILGWWVSGLVGLMLERVVSERLRVRMVARKRLTERYAIYGASEEARPMIERMLKHEGIEVVGLFDDRRTRVPEEIAGIPVSGGMAELTVLAEGGWIDRVVIALPLNALQRIAQLAKSLYALPLIIDIGFDACRSEIINFKSANRVAGSLLIEIFDRPLDGWRAFVKMCEDRVLSAILLLFALPLICIIAVAIKLDSPGPVFFRQRRYGFGGRVFEAMKFRTMYVAQSDQLGAQLTRRNDPRITRLGRVLRRTSLDEVPQLFNVLRGEMSLVGPRPHPLAAKAADVLYHEAIGHYALRHRVRPGITGWAQVNGWRGETETLVQLQKRVEYDLNYIEHWSLWLDIRILLRTAVCVFRNADVF